MQEQAGKYWVLFPAHAGVIPMAQKHFHEPDAFPRTRGGDPGAVKTEDKRWDFSPHTRG